MKPKLLIILASLVFFSVVNAQTDDLFKNGFEFLARLNDTGITWGGNYASGNNTTCTSNLSSPQDCNQGRDDTHNGDSDGHAGFSFTKLDATGTPLPDQTVDYATTVWACVKDNITGLVWEVKTVDGGLHDKNDTYNWYNTDPTTNGGAVGKADDDGNICYGYNASDSSTFCNTQAFAARVNSQSLCGQTDWRVPDVDELSSITNRGIVNPAIDANYFPNTNFNHFWSSYPYGNYTSHARTLNFGYGNDSNDYRGNDHYVRLVRGGQLNQ